MIQMVTTMCYCHFAVTTLCINVIFDLIVIGFPLVILKKIGILSEERFIKYATSLINWTTPIVYGMPLVFSGSKIYCNDIDLLVEAKSENSVLLANHGSRIDWMLAMFTGHSKLKQETTEFPARVGFICESILQYMPIVGWYRKLVCDDIFVERSISKDELVLQNNVEKFHKCGQKRMLFFSPEGVVVDFSEREKLYIQSCRDYCVKHGYKPFDYVLTPRHKGMACLMHQTYRKSGPIVSICIAYVRNGKLLNCKMSSSHRVIPDIHMMNQGAFGHPIDIYLYLRRIPKGDKSSDTRTLLMDEYKWKDFVLSKFDTNLTENRNVKDTEKQKLSLLEMNHSEVIASHILHAFVIVSSSIYLGVCYHLCHFFVGLFCVLSSFHTLGLILSSTSMDSVPFETGIKGTIMLIKKLKFFVKSKHEQIKNMS